jgi:hypothetical protein
VRAAPKRKMVVDWEGLTVVVGGDGMATAAVGNALVWAAVARSPVWMRDSSLAVRGGERGREKERRAQRHRAAF